LDRFVCIHGHFYQPPRENPWLESIEVQDGAAPFHDWNERITAECYEPNARARILNDAGAIERIFNNYSRISFNFGPTLLAWLEDKARGVYEAILEADSESMARFGGHGSAIAQVYNHVIMPLANRRDKETQVTWGIKDFVFRFGRPPEGMWLAETAVDMETLEVLAAQGIKFTVLAPHQAKRVRPLRGSNWNDVTADDLDTGVPYLVRLPTGRSIAVFFYEAALAQGVAFERVLEDGHDFGRRLVEGARREQAPRLSHIATDGETFGHHHRFGDMALAAALEVVAESDSVRLTNYGEFLEHFPPALEAEIADNTSWSCSHGIERWRSDCGDATGAHPGWNQSWREPLRAGLDMVRDDLASIYEVAAAPFFADPWEARNAYIHVVLDRNPASIEKFLRKEAVRPLEQAERERALRLLEMQRNAMLMFTSCGWFFDDISGLETVQILHYAARALELGEPFSEKPIELSFENELATAVSNRPERGNGRDIYRKQVKPSRVGLDRVAAVFAITSLFEPPKQAGRIHSFDVEQEDFELIESGRTRVSTGKVRVQSHITEEASRLSFATVDFGDHNIAGGVRPLTTDQDYDAMRREVDTAFSGADLTRVIRTIDTLFPGEWFSLSTLFRDELRAVLGRIAEPALERAEAVYRALYEENIPLMRFLTSAGYPLPHRFAAAAEFALNLELRRVLASEEITRDKVLPILTNAQLAGVEVDLAGVGPIVQKATEILALRLVASPGDAGTAAKLLKLVELIKEARIPVNLWKTQNSFYDTLKSQPSREVFQEANPECREMFLALGEALGVALE
jgi:alpha-amylase/alpha-mannosidase (GH57 family)